MRARSHRLISNLLKGGCISLFTLALLECSLLVLDSVDAFPESFDALNRAGPRFELGAGNGLYFSHPYNGYEYNPDYVSKRASINSFGFRGSTPQTLKKPSGTYRIVCLGASTTYSISVTDEHTYPVYLQQTLTQALPNQKIEVINAGLVSATTAESMVRLMLKALPLKPDMVIVYHGFNDIVPRVFNGWREDYLHFRKTPQYNRHPVTRLYTYRLLQVSALHRLTKRGWFSTGNLSFHTWKLDNLPKGDKARMVNFHATQPEPFKRNLEYILDLCRAADVEVVLSTFAFDDTLSDWTVRVPEPAWGLGIAQHNELIRQLASEYDCALVPFAEEAEGHSEWFSDSIHMNEEGNRMKGQIFADTVVQIISAEGDSP